MKRDTLVGLLVVCAFLSVSGGCKGSRMPELQRSGEERSYLLSSPLILAGTVGESYPVGLVHKESGHQARQLFRTKVTVNAVLQGRVRSSRLDVYWFLLRRNYVGPPTLGFWPGKEYIFYLRKQEGEWRTACDLYESCSDRVITGPHRSFKRDPARPVGEEILRLMLTRGDQVSDGVMIDGVPSRFTSRWMDDHDEAYRRILRQMAETETPPVRAHVCVLLHDLGEPCSACAPFTCMIH